MGFNDMRRKGAKTKKIETYAEDNLIIDVKDIPFENMEINFNGNVANFNRLRYLGCPKLSKYGQVPKGLKNNIKLVQLNRDEFVREMYELFQAYPVESETGYGRYCFLCVYVSYWDGKKIQIKFSEDEVLTYYKYREGLVVRGKINKNSLVKERQHLVSILKEMGRNIIASQLPRIKNRRQAAKSTKAIPDKPYAEVGMLLMKSYRSYLKYFFDSTTPLECLIFDRELALKNGMTEDSIKENKGAKFIECDACWTNTLSKLALLIVSMWTGGNLSPLTSLTKGDAKEIKKGSGDTYQFNSIKARALYERQSLGIGFTKRSKEFIESWIVVSEKIVSGDDTPLFPMLDKNGNLSFKKWLYQRPHSFINVKLKAMGLPEVTTRKFRSTRSSIIQRAYEDIFVTATANRNSVETTNAHYLEGVEENHEMELARAFEVLKALTEGKDKKEAIIEFRNKIKDPFSTEEWAEKRKHATANKTLSGARCTEPKGLVAEKSLRAIKSLNLGDERECISFLACFDCSKHALVANADDIWLMLSFLDSLTETISRPSINSFPSAEFKVAIDKTRYVLSRMKIVSPLDYEIANNRNKSEPHPLYQEDTDLTDLLEVYSL
jgi:hypothetical protein